MHFSKEQKLIVTLLTDIHQALKIKESVNPEFVQRMVNEDQGWALEWAYPGIFEGSGTEEDGTPREVSFVCDVLEMWEKIEMDYQGLSKAEKDELEGHAGVFGRNVKFPGFDGNREYSLLGIAKILINDLERWSCFGGRDLNSHMESASGYEQMLAVYEDLPGDKYARSLTIEELAKLLNERVHPLNR